MEVVIANRETVDTILEEISRLSPEKGSLLYECINTLAYQMYSMRTAEPCANPSDPVSDWEEAQLELAIQLAGKEWELQNQGYGVAEVQRLQRLCPEPSGDYGAVDSSITSPSFAHHLMMSGGAP